MALKTILLAVAVAFIALLRMKPVWCAVGTDCTAEGNECAATEKCVLNKCAARITCGSDTCTLPKVCVGPSGSETCVVDPCEDSPCGENGDCSYEKTVAAPKYVCTCKNGYGGTKCIDVTCGSDTCTLPKVCVGPSGSETCVVDPCEDSPCGENGDCSYEKTVAAPKYVCTCKNGYGGTKCTDVTCGSDTCTLPKVCVGPSGSETCVVDPCEDSPCGENGDCSYEKTVAAPKYVCTCKNGYGGTKCTDANGGNSVAVTPGILLAVLLATISL